MDPEKLSRLPPRLSGYPSFAAFLASDPDQTTAIYKRFNRLAARHLLHLQSELAELQAQQDELDEEEWRGNLTSKQYSRNWPEFCQAALHDQRQKQRKKLAEAIGVSLKEYREALFFESHLASLPPPTKRTLEACRHQFFNRSTGTEYPTLGAHSATLFDDADDLVALCKQDDRDRLTAFVQDHLAWIFQTRNGYGNIAYASDRRIARFVAILSTINAAALMIGAIVSLYAVASQRSKLGMIVVFTTLFAINVGVLTNARRAELFAASAGYAAVLVVFINLMNQYGQATAAGPRGTKAEQHVTS